MKNLPLIILGLLATAGVMLPLRGISQSQPAVPVAETNSPQIQALARGLQNDPVKIFNYVHDHIQYEHYFGSRKGAELTLLERRGNDFDQSALLAAMLRAAGYANLSYRFAFVATLYDDPNGQDRDLQHWFRLALPNTNWLGSTKPYLDALFGARGYPEEDTFTGDSNTYAFQRIWVLLTNGASVYRLDPSFKVSEYTAGSVNLASAMAVTSNSLMSAAGGTDTGNYVTNVSEANLRGTLAGYTTNFLNYLQSNAPNASVADVLGGWEIVPSTNTTLSQIDQSFPYLIYKPGTSLYWTYEPTNLMETLKITFAGTNYQWFLPQLQGQKVTLTFSNNGLAQLWQEDNLLAQHSTSGAGQTNVVFSIDHPFGHWDDLNNVLVGAGMGDDSLTNVCQRTNSTYAIAYAFSPDQSWLQQRQNQLDNYRQQGLPDTSRQVLSETLNLMALNWAKESVGIEKLLAAQLGILPLYHYRIGVMAQETGNGYYISIQNQSAAYANSGTNAASQAQQTVFGDMASYFNSALEHGVIEQLQGSNLLASSTVKMLEIANTNKQAVFLASSTNWTGLKSKLLHYNAAASNLLTAYINAGYYILLPQDGSNYVSGTSGWKGNGFMARLKTNGLPNDIAMIISGGYHGGFIANPDATPDTENVDETGQSQSDSFKSSPLGNFGGIGLDPVDMADGTFQVEHTDLTIGQTEPKGVTLGRYYNGTRRFSSPAGMGGGWIHNYSMSANTVAAPEASLGGTTPAQAATLIAATCAAVGVHDGNNPGPKNWLVSALIAKWGIDQLNKNSVSISLGKDTVQFIKQPNGVFTPPANCTMALTQINGAYSLLMRHGNQFNFNTNGLLNTIIDPYGNPLTLAYTNGNVKTVTDWKSRTLTFHYTGNQLTSVSDNNTPSRTVQYAYGSATSQGDLISFTDAEGKTSTYTYDANHQITATLDAQSRLVVSNVYDGFGHVATQYTEGNTNKAWQLFWSGWQTVEQDPVGSQRIFTYDDQTRLITLQDQLGNASQTFYDGGNHVVATVSPLGEINEFVYDANHNLTNVIDPLNQSTAFFYDAQNNLVRSVDPVGKSSTFGYNAQFSLTGSTNGAGDFVSFSYNGDGTLHTRADSGGTTIYDAYDAYGQLTHITYPGGLGGESFANSLAGDPTSHTDANGNITTFSYNNRRQMTNSVAPTNLTAKVSFDAVGNVATTTDPRGNVTSNTWNATRHLLTTTLPATPQGAPVVTNGYNTRDWLVRTADALHNPVLYTNDPAGRLASITDPVQRTARFSYDKDGRRLTSANAGNETNRQTWDARGSLVQLTDGAGHVSTRIYDAAGNQTVLTNRNGKPWKFFFDGANRLTNTVTPLGRKTILTFNHQGLMSSVTDPSNRLTSLNYDAKGRLTNLVDNLASTFYDHDANGNLTSIVENAKTNIWSYDAYNRVSSCQDVLGNLIQYRYDLNGNLTNLVYPGGKNVYYVYDALNRMTNVTDWSGRKSSVVYDLDSRMTSITRPNGSYRALSYDAAGQVTNIMEQMSNGLPIAVFKYNWTNTGTMAWEFGAPLPHSNSVPTRTMTYDDDNRLVTFQGPSMGSPQNVAVDLVGNITSAPLTNDTFAAYGYDARNRLLNSGGVTNVYDVANNRIGQTYGTNSVVFVVNPNAKLPQVLMRIKNGITNYYIYGPGLLYQITETTAITNTLTYHCDFRGSTIALSADNGLVTDRIEYSLYGLTRYRIGTNDTPFLFNGWFGVLTDPNGLLYMRARYYNPYFCRFINADPSGFAGGLNFYAYANGNPVSYIDPFGLGAKDEYDLSSWVEQPVENLFNLLYTGQINPSTEVWDGATGAAGDFVYDNSPVRGVYVFGGLDAHQTTSGIGGGYNGELIGLGGYDVANGGFRGAIGAVGTGPFSTGFENITGESGLNPILLVDSPQTGAGQGLGGFVAPGNLGQLQFGLYFYQQIGPVGVVGGGFYFDANRFGNYLNSDYWRGNLNP